MLLVKEVLMDLLRAELLLKLGQDGPRYGSHLCARLLSETSAAVSPSARASRIVD
jgi:hypothetical protein